MALLTTVVAAVVAGLLVAGKAPNRFGPSVMLGLLVPLLALPGRRPLIAIPAALATWCLVVGYMTFVPDHIDPLPDVSEAVGQAAYYGTPYVGPQIAAFLIAATLVLLGGLIAVLLARRPLASPSQQPVADREAPAAGKAPAGTPPGDRRQIMIMVLAVALVAFSLIPDPRVYFEPEVLPAIWDRANLLTWEALIARGLVPMRDFFYPYGGQWIYEVVPIGGLVYWLARTAMLALAAWSLWRPSGRRPWRVALCLLALPMLEALSSVALWRYLPALLIATTYAALGPARHRRLTRGHLAFGASCLLAIFLEPDLLIYGLAGMAMVLVGELIARRRLRPRELLRELALDSVPVVAALLVVVAGWAVIGALEGNLRFYLGLRAVSAGAAIDPELLALRQLSLDPSIYVVYLAVPALLLVAGLAQSLLAPERERPVGPLLMAAAGVSFIYLLKHLSRFTSDQAILIPLVALVWTAILVWDRRRLATAAAVGAFAGAMVVSVEQHTGITDYGADAAGSPLRAVNAALLPLRTDDVRETSDSRFAIDELPEWPEQEAIRQFRIVAGKGDFPDFWTLGDAQILYAMLDEEPPYQISSYDSSPIAEQREVIERLQERQPEYLIWSRKILPFADPVPYPVRTPLLYEYAVRNYGPGRRSYYYDVLRRRQPGEQVDARYWHQTLGRSLKLGFIPSYSKALEKETCAGGADCAEYVVAEGRAPAQGKSVKIEFRVGPRSYWLLFKQRRGQRTYPVPLDHVWFRPLLGANPEVRSATPGWSVRLAKLRDADSLY